MRYVRALIAAAVLIMSFPLSLQAAHVGSPHSVPLDIMQEKRLVLGGEGNFVSKRDLEPKAGQSNAIDESTQIGIKAEYGLAEGVSFFVKTGMADWTIKTGNGLKLTYDSTPYYGGGMKYMYKSADNIVLGGDIQYIAQSNVDLDSMEVNGSAATGLTGLEGEFTELQISVLLGYNIAPGEETSIIPYLGLGYSTFDIEIDAGSYTSSGPVIRAAEGYDSDNAIAAILGISVQLGTDISVNFEGRFVAEDALSLGMNYRF